MEPVRIAMWSGPRNISTAMMRSFENREDTAVIDEPFYAPYLVETGIEHPMRAEVLASRSSDSEAVIKELLGPVPNGTRIFYQKHMTHHMLPQFRRDWIGSCRNVFLIRAPEDVLASYTLRRANVVLEDIGFVQQRELFDQEALRLGGPPTVIDAADILGDPPGMLTALCGVLDIPYSERMLAWPPGRREGDGVWGAVWYESVERSTGFARSPAQEKPLTAELHAIAKMARPHYEYLARFKLCAADKEASP